MYTQVVTLSSTTYILMAMSWDRYKAICCPLDFNPSPSKARKVVAAAWLTALIFAIPNLFIYIQVEDFNEDGTTSVFYCHSAGYTANWQKKLNFIWLTCSVLIFPALWIAYCYFSVARVVWQQGNCQKMASIDGFTLLRKTCDIRVIPRAKIKTMKMSLTIVITFVVCWTPYFVVYNIRIFSDYKLSIPDSLMVLAETLALMSSAVNPIIYGCFNLRIRQGLQEACCFNLNVHSDKSRLSEPSGSTSSTVRFKSVRRENTCNGRAKRKQPNGDKGFEFARSTRHIQNKRSQTLQKLQAQEGCRDNHRALTNPFRSSTKRRNMHLNDNAFPASTHELQAPPTKSEENGVTSTTT
ncbi:unnamed protein product [Allacma fusca]|uniref:G-protein coupled receptors family 1 profile domain-containing protein n=1 Tax=Allacma fusca TaxID=39272 RepID=A0A8J2J5V9_9HEXA|nr:unnamed protein product [Allacma fusca]